MLLLAIVYITLICLKATKKQYLHMYLKDLDSELIQFPILKSLSHIMQKFQLKLFYQIQDSFSITCDALSFLHNFSDLVFNINN